MGRGVAYPHKFYMLYDEDEFLSPGLPDGTDDDGDELEFDSLAWEDFKRNVMKALKLDPKYDLLTGSAAHHGRESHFFAGDQNLKVGIDSSGGGPCIFVEAQWYEHNFTGEDKQYNIRKRVELAFNKLIQQYGPNMFRIATSGYTSMPLEKYAA